MRRFPLALLIALIGCTISTYLLWFTDIDEITTQRFLKFLQTLFISLPLAIAGRSLTLSYSLSRTQEVLFGLFVVVLGVAYYVFTPLMVNDNEFKVVTRFIGLLAASHLLVAFFPFWKGGSDLMFWEYNKTLFVNAWQGLFYTVAAGLGLMLAYLALDKLFGLNIEAEVYGTTWIWLVGLGFSVYFLFHFPRRADIQVESIEMDRVLDIFLRFILVPLVILYFIILYAYSGKILVQFSWPEGWISKLILGFSTLGVLGYLLGYPKIIRSHHIAHSESNRVLKYFGKYFFIALLPMSIVLMLALQRRIGEYGFTEPRYFAFMLGIWLGGVTLYMIMARSRSLVAIPISLMLGCILAVLGPLNAYQISDKNQWTRVQEVLRKNNMLEGKKIMNVPSIYEAGDSKKLSSAVDYYYASDRKNRMLTLLDSTIIDDVSNQYAVRSFLNIKDPGEDKQLWKGIFWNEKEPILLSGFSAMQRFGIVDNLSEQEVRGTIAGDSLVIGKRGEPPLAVLSIRDIRDLIIASNTNSDSASLQDVSLESTYEGKPIRIVFTNLSMQTKDDLLEGFGYLFY